MRPTPGTHVFLYMQDEICKNGICENESWRKNTGRGENKNPQPSNE